MLMLLDLDGTLINDRGYRAAIDATVTRYAVTHDLPAYPPVDDEVHLLHAHGYSNEWDSVAFLAGILHHASHLGRAGRPDYEAWIRKTASFDGLPNERARGVLLRESPAELHGVIHALLDNVTDVAHAPTTRLFAETILGSELFSLHYGLPGALNAVSLLQELDEPLIDARSREFILAQRACVFTARPSLPPGHGLAHARDGAGPTWAFTHPAGGGGQERPVHPPEAEIGLRLLGLEHLPMIALGHVQWLADQHQERVYDLTKPSPVQALAAFLTAVGVAERPALKAAYAYWKRGEPAGELTLLNGEDAFVLEDNAAGVRACHQAADMLNRSGINVRVRGVGISASPVKRAALQPYCDRLYQDVNTALRDFAGSAGQVAQATRRTAR